jgi:OOP family OmpA-OmpF porin
MPAPSARLALALAAGATVLGAGAFGWSASGALESRAEARVLAMARASGLDWLSVSVDGLSVEIAGAAPDAAAADGARAAAAAAGRFARVVDAVRTTPAPIAPPEPALEIRLTPDGAALSGIAPSAVARKRLLAALPDGVDDTATDAADDGAEPSGWRMVEVAAAAAARALEKGRIALSPAALLVSGSPRSPADRAAIEALAAGLAAENVAVTLDLAEVAPPGAAETPALGIPVAAKGAWLRVRATADLVLLTGAAPDAATRDAVLAFASALFGSDRMHQALALSDAPAAEGWRAAAFAAMEALAALETGEAEAMDGRAALDGSTRRPAAVRLAQDALGAAAAAGWRTTSRVTVDLPGRAAQALLPLALCAERLTEITSAGPILFAPGSAEIEAASGAALDDLAAVLARCAGGRIAVEGHTDSQGSTGYNQRLSQRRAEAVRDALVARGAPYAKLAARGYGQERPIADNATEEGRARNRRIAFAALDADGGAVTEPEPADATDPDRSAEP